MENRHETADGRGRDEVRGIAQMLKNWKELKPGTITFQMIQERRKELKKYYSDLERRFILSEDRKEKAEIRMTERERAELDAYYKELENKLK